MDQNSGLTMRGYYSLIRYRPDPVREEFRNVGVLLLGEDGAFHGLRTLRPGALGRNVEEQGLLAAVLAAVERQLSETPHALRVLADLSATYEHSILFSEPRPAMSTAGWRALLDSLYSALVAPKGHPSVGFTKGHVLDRLHKWFVAQGSTFEIGGQLDGYSFDAVLRTSPGLTYAMQVNSFAARHLDRRRLELEVAHFLYVAPRVHAACFGLIQPAAVTASDDVRRLQDRVATWFSDAGVPVLSPAAFRAQVAGHVGRDLAEQQQLALAT